MAIRRKMENTKIFDFENLNSDFKKLKKEIEQNRNCSIFGVQNSLRPALISSFEKKVLYVTADSVTAKFVCSQFEIMGKSVLDFEPVHDTFLYKHAGSNEAFIQRSKNLFKIIQGEFDVLVAPIQSLFSFLPSVSDFKSHILALKKSQNIIPETLERILVESGYKRETLISEAGQFSRRGEVFDIFPINSEVPFRIDFFDTEIETIKVFDIQSQRGTKEIKSIKICPNSDLFLTDEEIDKLIFELEKIKKKSTEDISIQTIFNNEIDEIKTRLLLKDRSYGLDVLSVFLDDFRSTIFDYFKASKIDILVAFDECKIVYDSMTSGLKELSSRLKELKNSGTLIAGNRQCFFDEKELLKMFEEFCSIGFLKITNTNKLFKSDAVFNFKTSTVSRYTHNLKEFAIDLRAYKLKGYSIFIFAGSKEQATHIKNILSAHDLEFDFLDKENISKKGCFVLPCGYANGFILSDDKCMVVGTYDIFAKKREENKLKATRENVFSVPKVGDYVVHSYHGIGICEGVTQLSGNLGTQDYVIIRYDGGDKLYVPTSHMDMLDRFSGANAPKRLSKIGGQDFSAVKSKVRESIKKLAFSLIELYAKREKIKGHAFSADTDLQREFENSFPYTETEDQLISTEEIKNDMEKQKVMDRLLCGDVGFGKTEVALRAIFKAIMDGKQVAFVAPTTILSEQHYNTARARMFDFGVNIEVLNRFKTKAQAEKILADIASGKVDLVCGTHRVFSDDVAFKNLGLIVLDEEQKFGVEDKEKLKNKYPDIDVLTLSATPIPRTLNMSLSGIRDISIISTPPSERLPIQTYIVEYSDALVKDAITREVSRDGQVFILFNSVEKIYTFAEQIRRLVPDKKILVAHGQMSSKLLEQVIYDFYHKKADILICTTIIENGIDIENANTLIVCDSDKLGLSQLYQIRGRVGRSSKMAYAYFTYDSRKVLTEDAYKRLDAMSEFCEFGSGFKLAMRDLEIRGGGNILGAEQSGHLQKIGYDMYSKLLAECIKELKGEKIDTQKDVLVKVALDAYVPDTYISTSEERMIAYKRISAVDSIEAVEKLKVELENTYGKIPVQTQSLISIALVRQLAGKIGAVEVRSFGGEVQLIFEDVETITSNEIIGDAIFKCRMNCALDMSKEPMIKFSKHPLCRDNFEDLKQFLLIAKGVFDKNSAKN